MPDGGFVVKFNGKTAFRCYAVAFDYDEGVYKMNNETPQPFPQGIAKIEVIVEDNEIK
ncbi:MAG: hypothetical protein HQL24_08725 [Candidatus Omnitrophica bacterium]|nr:hypothetical protein [Candidatus Omnitrophota bacterium]